jgi:hypothetical protein
MQRCIACDLLGQRIFQLGFTQSARYDGEQACLRRPSRALQCMQWVFLVLHGVTSVLSLGKGINAEDMMYRTLLQHSHGIDTMLGDMRACITTRL